MDVKSMSNEELLTEWARGWKGWTPEYSSLKTEILRRMGDREAGIREALAVVRNIVASPGRWGFISAIEALLTTPAVCPRCNGAKRIPSHGYLDENNQAVTTNYRECPDCVPVNPLVAAMRWEGNRLWLGGFVLIGYVRKNLSISFQWDWSLCPNGLLEPWTGFNREGEFIGAYAEAQCREALYAAAVKMIEGE